MNTITFDLTINDLVSLTKNTFLSLKNIIVTLITVTLLSAVLLEGYSLYNQVAVTILLGVIAFVGVYTIKVYQSKSNYLSNPKQSGMGNTILKFGKGNCELITEVGNRKFQFSEIKKVQTTKRYIYIFISKSNALIIPYYKMKETKEEILDLLKGE